MVIADFEGVLAVFPTDLLMLSALFLSSISLLLQYVMLFAFE